MAKVVIIGSCMIDFSFYAPRLPLPGETLHGNKFVLGYGGKGANQCVAASKLGASTALIAKLGDDTFGQDYIKVLKEYNVNTEHVSHVTGVSSGVAEITIAENGNNSIVIIAGANNTLSTSDVDQASSLVKAAQVVVFQFETPIATTIHALRLLTKGISIVNGAPAVSNPDSELLRLASIFCVNETEAGAMTNMSITTVSDASKALLQLLNKGCNTVIITLGEKGAVYATKENRTAMHISSVVVKSIDSTGAGDMFVGALAYYIAYLPSLSLQESISRSCKLAAMSVQSRGTHASFPRREQLTEDFFKSV